jgi:hypothetical protein
MPSTDATTTAVPTRCAPPCCRSECCRSDSVSGRPKEVKPRVRRPQGQGQRSPSVPRIPRPPSRLLVHRRRRANPDSRDIEGGKAARRSGPRIPDPIGPVPGPIPGSTPRFNDDTTPEKPSAIAPGVPELPSSNVILSALKSSSRALIVRSFPLLSMGARYSLWAHRRGGRHVPGRGPRACCCRRTAHQLASADVLCGAPPGPSKARRNRMALTTSRRSRMPTSLAIVSSALRSADTR